MDIKNLAAWDKFAKSGKVEDYLQYKHLPQENKLNENEHRRIDNKGTQNEWR